MYALCMELCLVHGKCPHIGFWMSGGVLWFFCRCVELEGSRNQKKILFVAGIRLAALLRMARQRVPAAPPPWARQSWATWVKDVDHYPGLLHHARRRDKKTLPRHGARRDNSTLLRLTSK
jgi:hypothetical protein